jgi:Methyltransferase FkbM domain
VQHPRFDVRKQRLVGVCEEGHDVALSTLIEACPGADQSILCKLDIEGAEWDVFAQPVAGLGRCRQIMIEFHHLAEFALPERLLRDRWDRRGGIGAVAR